MVPIWAAEIEIPAYSLGGKPQVRIRLRGRWAVAEIVQSGEKALITQRLKIGLQFKLAKGSLTSAAEWRHLMACTVSVGRAIALLLLTSLPVAGLKTAAAQQDRKSDISSDETVVFFRGVAVETGLASFDAHIRGWIFESLKGKAAIDSIATSVRALIGLDSQVLPVDQLRERGKLLFVDTERNQKVPIDIAGRRVTLAASEPGGHFEDRVALRDVQRGPGEWITYRALTKPGDDREFAGAVQLVARTGLSVVSDIDDTIKDSNVLDKRELALNTFVRDFRGVPGMSDLYQGWARTGGVVFHYVSGSPWQLLAPIADFMERDSFPRGSLHLRRFRVKDKSAREFLENRTLEFKVETIDRLMALLPDRRFVFVGDSGEKLSRGLRAARHQMPQASRGHSDPQRYP